MKLERREPWLHWGGRGGGRHAAVWAANGPEQAFREFLLHGLCLVHWTGSGGNRRVGWGLQGQSAEPWNGKEADQGHVNISGQHLRIHVRLGATENFGKRMLSEESPIWVSLALIFRTRQEDSSRSHRRLHSLTRPGARDGFGKERLDDSLDVYLLPVPFFSVS